ncbi:MAG: succinate dehydrogenase/fumarate reductase iron-sulfur subunit [Deltaproteobacteria bacterium]|nr:succinate dehydrogenase/fumarate reductase iron-sulfur subunit [Deltaproteobacteria bacterium]
MKIKFKIRRYNPSEKDGTKPYFQAYTVDVAEGMTVLEALLKIGGEQDPTLSFRKSCRSAICGSCAVSVNGFSRLACETQILPEYKKTGEMTLEPLANHAPVKDLMVDFSPFWNKMAKVQPYLTPKDEDEMPAVTAEDQAVIDRSQKCIMCGSCNAECNALEIDANFIGPAGLAKAWRLAGDVREGKKYRRLEKLSDEHGMWDCVRCVHCTQCCPKDVSPLKAIELLRAAAIKEGITDNHGAKHAVSMANSVKRVGMLDEAAMTFKTLGFLRSLGMIPFGLKMEFHGKMPKPLIFEQIENMDEVRAIYEEIEKGRAGKG